MTEVLRIIIIALALLDAGLIVALNAPLKAAAHQGFGHLMSRGGIVLLLLSVAYATAESYARRVPGASRLWVLLIGLIWLTVGCLAMLRERRKDKR